MLGRENLAGRHARQLLVIELRPALLHDLLEAGEHLVYQGLQHLPLAFGQFGRAIFGGTEHLLERTAGDRIVLDVELLQELRDVEVRNDDAYRARERGRLGEDHVFTAAVGHRDIVAATGRDAAHAHHHRQVAFLGQFGQPVVKLIAAADRATRGIDAEHDRLDALVLRDVVELRTGEAAAPHDGAGDVDDRHLGGRHPRERVVFLHHLCIALEILCRGTGAGQRRQQRNACDRPGDPGAPAAPEAALFQDHSCGQRRWHLFDLHGGTPAGGGGEGKRQFAIFPRIPLPLDPWQSRFSGTAVPREA